MPNIIKKILKDKQEYKEQMARVEALPEEYRFVFKKIQKYMWGFAGGDGLDMLKAQYGLIELFEISVADGKQVLEVTGEDVAGFCEDFMTDIKKWTDNYRDRLNRDFMKKFTKENDSK